jgi:polar amino acid transport system substrate-binding protein
MSGPSTTSKVSPSAYSTATPANRSPTDSSPRANVRVRVYDYGAIRSALTDLTTGAWDAFMKLVPVLTELVKTIPGVEVVHRGITVENTAIALPLDDQALLSRITVAQAELEQNGTLQRIRRKWLGNPYAGQHLAVH